MRVLLVENDRCTAKEVASHFRRRQVIVAIAESLAQARTMLLETMSGFDVVIADVHLPDGRGESLLPHTEVCPRQPAVILTSAGGTAIQAAALEYRPVIVTKPISPAALLRMATTVVGGYTHSVLRRFVQGFALSGREIEAVVLVAQGLRPKEAAQRMTCSEPTIYGHLTRACTKMGCSHYQEITARLLAFACQSVGHTPPDHRAFVDRIRRVGNRR